jgi:hypothetical protein
MGRLQDDIKQAIESSMYAVEEPSDVFLGSGGDHCLHLYKGLPQCSCSSCQQAFRYWHAKFSGDDPERPW